MGKWNFHFRERIEQFGRYRHIMAVLMKYGFEEAAWSIGKRVKMRSAVKAEAEEIAKSRSRPVRARMALEELGPTFIKLGQLLSTRPDLVPVGYIAELEHLQDSVAPEKSELVCAEIEKELGGKLDELFGSFEVEPIAAGSIAQVHRATTLEGESVVVKVRRPGIEKAIRAECRILGDLAGLLKIMFFEDDTIDPKKMIAEFNEAVSKEVDLANERRNQLRFLHNFASDPAVHIPQVYERYCSDGVLTMEYIDGIKPGDAEAIREAGLDPKIIAERGAGIVFRQIFEFGLFHTDPHPGNFFLLKDNVLAPIDFGQVARLSLGDRRVLSAIVQAIVDNDVTRMIGAFEQANMISERTKVERLVSDAEQMIETYHDLPLKEIPFAKVLTEIFDLIRKHHIEPPSQFTLMLKSLMTIESFAVGMDPDFEIIKHLKPYARRFAMEEWDPKKILQNVRKTMRDAGDMVSRMPEDVNAILRKFRQGQFKVHVHHEHLENLNKTLDKSSNRVSFALIIAALLVGSSLLVPQEGMVLGWLNLQTLGVIGYVVAAVIGLWLLVSIIRSRHL